VSVKKIAGTYDRMCSQSAVNNQSHKSSRICLRLELGSQTGSSHHRLKIHVHKLSNNQIRLQTIVVIL